MYWHMYIDKVQVYSTQNMVENCLQGAMIGRKTGPGEHDTITYTYS